MTNTYPANPVAVEVTRGPDNHAPWVESRHRAACAVVAASGSIVHQWGDVEEAIFPRSAIKPLQVLPLLESGAADAWGLGAAEISLACASHNSEPRHLETVGDVLGRAGLTEDALECGPQISTSPEVAEALIREGETASRIRNNCSGKHMGFLATAAHVGDDPAGYVGRDHPVQQRVLQAISEMCEIDLTDAPWGIDGCSIPAFALPLQNLAHGMARLAAPEGLGPTREAACTRVVQSIAAEPFMIAGTGRFCTAINQALKGKAVVKTGAEGVMMAALPGPGFGVALKVDDGTGRANGVALAAVLRFLGVLDDATAETIADYLTIPITDRNGNHVGDVRPAPNWPA
jgi:L-asparaginase II